MKTFIYAFNFVILYLLFITSKIYSQSYTFHFNTPQRFTNGFADKNPTFGRRETYMDPFTYIEFDLIAFERKTNINDTASQICAAKIDTGGLNSITYITNDGYTNRNPSLAYAPFNSYQLVFALILWESFRNGRSDIYGRVWNNITGWGTTFAVDTSNANKFNPSVYGLGTTLYAVTYEREGEIVYKQIETNTFTFTDETNITSSDTAYCSNPIISRNFFGVPYYEYITYQRRKPNMKNAIYFTRQSYSNSGSDSLHWLSPDTLYTQDDNRNSDLNGAWSLSFYSFFENYRSGRWNALAYNWNQLFNFPTNANRDNTQLNYFINGDFSDFFYVAHFVYREKGQDSIKIKLKGTFSFGDDSLTIGDTASNNKISMNDASSPKKWVIYDKSSGTNSSLYGVSITNDIISGTQNSEANFPKNFYLHQNYPNPFNPKTVINYELPITNYVVLKVYDVLGKEVALLVNVKQNAGRYTVEFTASNFASGIYFYKLETDGFTDIKRMILIK